MGGKDVWFGGYDRSFSGQLHLRHKKQKDTCMDFAHRGRVSVDRLACGRISAGMGRGAGVRRDCPSAWGRSACPVFFDGKESGGGRWSFADGDWAGRGGEKVLLVFGTGLFLQSLVAVVLLLLKKAKKQTQIPFAPFLLAARMMLFFL